MLIFCLLSRRAGTLSVVFSTIPLKGTERNVCRWKLYEVHVESVILFLVLKLLIKRTSQMARASSQWSMETARRLSHLTFPESTHCALSLASSRLRASTLAISQHCGPAGPYKLLKTSSDLTRIGYDMYAQDQVHLKVLRCQAGEGPWVGNAPDASQQCHPSMPHAGAWLPETPRVSRIQRPSGMRMSPTWRSLSPSLNPSPFG